MRHQKPFRYFTLAAITVCLSITTSLVCFGQNQPEDTVNSNQSSAIDPALNFPRTGPLPSRLTAELLPNHEASPSTEAPQVQPTEMPQSDQKPATTLLPLIPNDTVNVANVTQSEPATSPQPVTEKHAERSLEVTSQLPEVVTATSTSITTTTPTSTTTTSTTTTTTTPQPPSAAPIEVTSNEPKSSEETSSSSTPLKTSNGSTNSEEVVTDPKAQETSKSDKYQLDDTLKAEPAANSARSALSPVYLCPAIIIVVLGVTLATMLGCSSYRRRRGAGSF